MAERIDEIREALKSLPVSTTLSEVTMATKAKKVVKKVSKKAAPAATKKAAPAGDIVTLAELAEAAGISAQRARQKLREAEFIREGRWSWERGHKEIAKVEAILAGKGE